jgi:hypothetical protein
MQIARLRLFVRVQNATSLNIDENAFLISKVHGARHKLSRMQRSPATRDVSLKDDYCILTAPISLRGVCLKSDERALLLNENVSSVTFVHGILRLALLVVTFQGRNETTEVPRNQCNEI